MRYLFSAVLVLCSLHGICQLFAPADYPRDYFRDPLAIPMSLAANFGELRPNHYHMGLDIRTQHRENLPVYAAADGYIARVSIEPFGFGQAVYINHPNGFTTVYGHLNKFFPALAAYIHKEQYRRRSWQVYLELPPSLFPVRKGDVVAYSGNTGGSQGPHLHFEIRRTAGDVNLNPLLFGLPVPDNTAPAIQRLAWYDRSKSVYEQSPHFVAVKKTGNQLAPGSASPAGAFLATVPAQLVVPVTHISFALQAFDTQSGSANPNGIFEADLFMDERPVIGFQMDKISYDHTRNINAHIDYKTRITGGPFLQQLFFLSGYPLPSIYSVPNGANGRPADPAALLAAGGHPPDGVLDIGDGRPHAIWIEVRDTYGNTSRLSFEVQYKPAERNGFDAPPAERVILPTDHMASPAEHAASPAGKRFYPGMVDGLETPGCAFYLGEKSLYDSVTIGTIVAGYPGLGRRPTEASSPGTDIGASLPGGVSPTYAIGEPWIPLLEPVLVRMQYPGGLHGDSLTGGDLTATDINRVVMVCFNGAEKDVQRPEWHDGWASARFRSFGDFQLVEDVVPPVITALQPLEGVSLAKAARIAFSVKDDLGAVRDFTAELDGSWLCFTNDKALAYIYTFDEHCPPGAHTLKVTATDIAGNRTIKEYHFIR